MTSERKRAWSPTVRLLLARTEFYINSLTAHKPYTNKWLIILARFPINSDVYYEINRMRIPLNYPTIGTLSFPSSNSLSRQKEPIVIDMLMMKDLQAKSVRVVVKLVWRKALVKYSKHSKQHSKRHHQINAIFHY